MKRTISCLVLLILGFNLFAQNPMGFSYQAVLHTADGGIMSNQTVELRVSLYGSDLSTLHYMEMHTVTTNAFGLMKVVIGEGAVFTGEFDKVPWGASQIHMKIEMQPSTSPVFIDMGTQPLQTVPYALHAPASKSVDSDATADDDEPIFVVRNKEGQIVFAVYQDGVEINIDEDQGKSRKAGFAIGGLSGTKDGDPIKYMQVTPGHTSIQFESDDSKSRKAGFAIGGLSRTKDGDVVDYLSVTPELTSIKFDEDDSKSRKAGFAIGGLSRTKDGEDVDYLSVTPELTSIKFDGDDSKSRKAGFAIGGLSRSKDGEDVEYLNVTPELTSIKFEEDDSKSRKAGFAIGGLSRTKSESKSFFDITTDDAGIINPAENCVLWYPQKNAFLAGRVLIETPDNVGENSFAVGYESKSKGEYSQAMGFKAQALGNYSTAIGNKAEAQKINSFAFGEDAVAKNDESYAIGRGATAEGYRSFALGSAGIDSIGAVTQSATAKGDYSFAIGQGASTLGRGAFAIGISTAAQGAYSTALGYKTIASDYFATAMGQSTVASGNSSVAMGWLTDASGITAIAAGYLTEASGQQSVAMGSRTEATGPFAVAMGMQTKSLANGSTAFGRFAEAKANASFAVGEGTVANTARMTALGSYNQYGADNIFVWNANDPIFVIGNGSTAAARKNALTVLKGGRIGLQTVVAPTYALQLPNSATIGVGRGQANEWNTYSDNRVKSNQQPIHYGLTEIMLMTPKSYFHHNSTTENGSIAIASEGKQEIGLVAQEMYEIIPEVVSKPENEQAELWGLSYEKLVPVLIKAIQEQQEMIDLMRQEIELLKQK